MKEKTVSLTKAIIISILGIIITGLGVYYSIDITSPNYKQGFQDAINQTLNNYTCTPKEQITILNISQNISSFQINFNSNCVEVPCLCANQGCLAYCMRCEK